MSEALILMLEASVALWAALTLLVLARKSTRDRREASSSRRRGRFEVILLHGDDAALDELMNAARRNTGAQLDALRTLQECGDGLPSERRAAVRRIAQESGLEQSLRAGLKSSDAVRRGRSALLLAQIAGPDAAIPLSRLLRDPDPDARLAACRALADAGGSEAAAALIGGLGAGLLPPERLVERLTASWAVEPLLWALRHAEVIDRVPAGEGWPPLRASLARALGLVGDGRAEPALLGLLRSRGVEERLSAARALRACGGPRSVSALLDALTDPEWTVRAQAASALGHLGGPAAAGPLGRCLRDRSWWVRANAAESLRNLGAAGVAVLRAALEDPDRFARDRAREALDLLNLQTTTPQAIGEAA
jgi:HEAT repeat protein